MKDKKFRLTDNFPSHPSKQLIDENMELIEKMLKIKEAGFQNQIPQSPQILKNQSRPTIALTSIKSQKQPKDKVDKNEMKKKAQILN